jgi:hypothetical protein
VDRHLQNAHVKIEVTKEQMISTEKRADEAMEKQLETSRRLQEISMTIAKFEAESATFAEVMEVLYEGLKAFGELKEQWTKLLAFFQMMTNLINTSLGPPLEGFVKHAREIGEDRKDGYDTSLVCKELIYQTSFEAVKVAYLVNSLSGAYCDISRDHMMPLVSRLGTLIALDKAKDVDQIRTEKKELDSKAKAMQKTIEGIIRDKNKQLHEQLGRRSRQMELAFNQKVPTISPEKKADIQRNVRQATEKAGDQIEDLDMADFS